MGELEKIKEISESIVAILMQLQNRDEPGGLTDINLKGDDWDDEWSGKHTD